MEIVIVRPGDSLWSIASRYGTSAEELARINQLNDRSRLVPKLALLVPSAETGSRPGLEVNGYAYPNIAQSVLNETLPYLSYLCPFSYHMTTVGELIPIPDSTMVDAARANSVAPLLTITNLGESGGFSGDIAHAVFTNQQVQDRFFENMFSALHQKPYYGVNFNIEYVYPYDRDSYSQFLRRSSEALRAQGYFLSTAIAPKESDSQEGLLYTAHDYEAHGRWADRVIIMAYEWGYTYSAPQAVSPVNRIRRVLEYAVTRIPPGKILMGFSNYGYNWNLPWKQGDAARVISNAAALNLAVSAGADIKFDQTAQAPFFTYTDSTGQRHVVWFEDVRSIRAKLQIVSENALLGAGYWNLMRPFAQNWSLLNVTFVPQRI